MGLKNSDTIVNIQIHYIHSEANANRNDKSDKLCLYFKRNARDHTRQVSLVNEPPRLNGNNLYI